MHRSTGANTLHRSYASGGSRSLIDEVDDGPLMQTMKGNAMKGEVRKDVESPQNYGFTSAVAPAEKGKDGQIEQSAEGFMSYMGGNRSFPVMPIMDDRRHRLKNLVKDAAKGSSAMYGLKEWGQQILNTEDGQYITGNLKKKNRMQLVENKNGQKAQQQQGGGGAQAKAAVLMVALEGSSQELVAQAIRNAEGRLVLRSKSGVEFEIEEFIDRPAAHAGNGSGAAPIGPSGGQQQGTSKATGQKTLHKEETEVYVEQNGTDTTSRHGEGYATQKSGSDSSTHWEKDKKKSTQCTEKHTHIRFQDFRIFNDDEGNWSTTPILVKKDKHCKEG